MWRSALYDTTTTGYGTGSTAQVGASTHTRGHRFVAIPHPCPVDIPQVATVVPSGAFGHGVGRAISTKNRQVTSSWSSHFCSGTTS